MMKKTFFTFCLSFFLSGCASHAASPSDISDKEIESYKYGMDRGCRDEGARKGDSQEKIDRFCGCISATLNKTVKKSEWQQVMYFWKRKQEREEMALMGRHLADAKPEIAACQAKPENMNAESRSRISPTPSIIGAWEWARKQNGCKETYRFLPTGTALISSGREKTENIYQASEISPTTGRVKLTMVATKTNGEQDCADSKSEITGKSSVNYIMFHPEGKMLLMCSTETGTACFGPLTRIQE